MKTIELNPEKKFNAILIPDLNSTEERKSPLVSGSIAILGIAALMFSFNIKENLTDLSLFLLITGIGLLLTSLILLINKKNSAYYLQKNNKIKESILELSYDKKTKLNQILKKMGAEKSTLDFRNNQGQIKVDLLIAKDKQFTACYISQYVPYEYKSVSEILCFYNNESEEFIKEFATLGLKV